VLANWTFATRTPPALLFGVVREGGGTALEGYCVKCRAKKEIKDAKQVTLKNGRPATQGKCPDCGTGITKIGKAS
jgi:hypothetical protein